eukprot:GHVH01012288.1.p1 GENE.GHVH01012288.1~~GHVH01012288.1.p1  ORF type:complete len:373 (+),score=55.59 GHVH01012288.1:46-1119(+)
MNSKHVATCAIPTEVARGLLMACDEYSDNIGSTPTVNECQSQLLLVDRLVDVSWLKALSKGPVASDEFTEGMPNYFLCASLRPILITSFFWAQREDAVLPDIDCLPKIENEICRLLTLCPAPSVSISHKVIHLLLNGARMSLDATSKPPTAVIKDVPEALASIIREYGNMKRSREDDTTIIESRDSTTTKKLKTSCDNFDLINGEIVVYTDGNCKSNGKKGALAGVGVFFKDGSTLNVAEKLPGSPQTNQRAELTAIKRCLEVLIDEGKMSAKVKIITDSEYSKKIFTEWISGWKKRGWKKADGGDVKNCDIICPVDVLLTKIRQEGGAVTFEWTKGHDGRHGNEMADQLATQGMNP